jgi:hypothetical protein
MSLVNLSEEILKLSKQSIGHSDDPAVYQAFDCGDSGHMPSAIRAERRAHSVGARC